VLLILLYVSSRDTVPSTSRASLSTQVRSPDTSAYFLQTESRAERVGVSLTLRRGLVRIPPGIAYPEWGFSWPLSLPPGKWRGST